MTNGVVHRSFRKEAGMGGVPGPYTPGVRPCPLIKPTNPKVSNCRIAPSARALDPLWNLRPNCTTWQSFRSKNSDSISMAYLVGAPGLEPGTR
jgi:hypothetical protein